jgi:multiple sugar transport system ATP-binding protein
MAAISLQGLVKHFAGFPAIKHMDLEIRDKEFMALLGPSGCGKSTTMNIIAGMEMPSAGKVMFDAADVSHTPMSRRGVGFVFQNYAIFTHMTVRQNLAYGLKMRRLPRAEIDAKVAAIAELLQLGPYLDQPSRKLSVNILQRLAIGRSAAVGPAIFLLDEPLSNVDAAFRAVMRTELKHLQRELGQTMVYVTHDQLEAMTNIFVAAFLGAPGMNLLRGTAVERDGHLAVDFGAAGCSDPLPPELAAGLRQAGSQDLYYGVRPENLAFGPADGRGVTMTAVFVERIGPRAIIHLEAEDRRAKLVTDNMTSVVAGERLRLSPQDGAIRLFDAATGRAVREA